MITFKKFLSEAQLHVFDIDDTLFHTTALIKVRKDGKIIHSLTNQEFNSYKLKSGEKFDFDEFGSSKKFHDESVPMHTMLDNLKRIHNRIKNNLSPGSKIIMNTARGDFDDKDKFLDKFKQHGVDIDDIHVHRAGTLPGDEPPATKKLVFIRRYLDKKPYKEVFMYDDSRSNLRAFLTLQKEYPDTKFNAFFVTNKGVIQAFKG